MTATLFAIALSSTASAMTIPEVSLATELGTDPVDSGVTVEALAAPDTVDVLVTLTPPSGGSIDIPFADPDPWTENRDGTWSAQISADDAAASVLLIDVSDSTGQNMGAVRIDTALGSNAAGDLTVGVTPEGGWIGDLIEEILTADFCEAYTQHGFPSESPSAAVWDYCRELLGL